MQLDNNYNNNTLEENEALEETTVENDIDTENDPYEEIINKYELIYSDVPEATVLTCGDNLQIRRVKETGEYEVDIDTLRMFNDFEEFEKHLYTLKNDMLCKLGLKGKVPAVNFDMSKVIAVNYTPQQIKTYMYKKLGHYIRECLYLYDCKQATYF